MEDPHGLVPWVNEVGTTRPGRADLIHPPRKGVGVYEADLIHPPRKGVGVYEADLIHPPREGVGVLELFA